MKKIFKPVAASVFLLLISLSQPINAQISDAQRYERCQNNKNKVAELEAKLEVINADLSASMTKKELEDARTQMVYVKSVRLGKVNDDRTKLERIAAQYNFKIEECFYSIRETTDKPYQGCAAKLEKIIAAKIDKALTLNRSALLAKKKTLDQEIAVYRNRMIELDCDNLRGKIGSCKIQGVWTQDTPGIGSTSWDIKSDGTASEEGIGYANGKATLKEGILRIEWRTNTGYSGYYEWALNDECTAGSGTLVFKTGRTDTMKSSVKRN